MGTITLALLLQLAAPLVAASPVAAVDGPAFAAAMVGREIQVTLIDKRVVGGTMVSRAHDGYVIATGDEGVVVTVREDEIVEMRVDPPFDALRDFGQQLAALEVRPATTVVVRAPQAKAYVLPVGTSPIIGAKKAPIVLTVFGNAQCPHTAKLMVTLRAILDDPRFVGRTQVVFKHMPLSFMPGAVPAAKAAEAARALGGDAAFFAMLDKAFANQSLLESADYAAWAGEIGLDAAAFAKKLVALNDTSEAIIAADTKLAESAAVRGTPTLFVGGWEVERRTADSIDAIIKQKKLKR